MTAVKNVVKMHRNLRIVDKIAEMYRHSDDVIMSTGCPIDENSHKKVPRDCETRLFRALSTRSVLNFFEPQNSLSFTSCVLTHLVNELRV